MRSTPLPRRLGLAYMGLILAILSLAGIYLLRHVSDLFIETAARDLSARASVASELVMHEGWPWSGSAAAGDAAAVRIAAAAESRVTVIATDGTVIAESSGPSAAMANHADRPEFAEAAAGRVGVCRRYSETREERMLYVAVPFSAAGADVDGVVRLAVSLEWIWARIAAIRNGLLIALGGSLLAAGCVGLYAGGRMVTAPLTRVVEGARRMLGGDLATRIELETGDEWQILASSLNAMAGSLDRQLRSLAAERNRVRDSLEGLPDGVLLLGPAGSLQLANRRARQWLALPAWLGDYQPEPAAPDRAPGRVAVARAAVDLLGRTSELRKFVASALAGGEVLRREVSIGGPASARLEVTASWVGLPEASDLVVVLHDVSEVRRLETARRNLVANVSHELKTPVGAIRVLAETLSADASADPALLAEFLGRIVRETERLAGLIDKMLYLSRLEGEVDSLSLSPADLGDITARAVDALSPLAGGKSIRIAWDRGSDTRLRCDPGRVESAVTALLDNAIKFSPPGTAVSLRTASLAGEVEFVVEDQGPGIPSDVLERVFERFYKADESRLGPGSGLGLAIVKHVVQSHGGRVFARSTFGAGSTFGFTLPRRPA